LNQNVLLQQLGSTASIKRAYQEWKFAKMVKSINSMYLQLYFLVHFYLSKKQRTYKQEIAATAPLQAQTIRFLFALYTND